MSTPDFERWLPVVGWETLYEVSSCGRVRSLARQTSSGRRGGVLLNPQASNKGYLRVRLCNRDEKRYGAHRLVAEAFIGPCPKGLVCCHGDGNRANNNVANLRWDTLASNQADRLKHGTHGMGERNARAKLNAKQVLAIRADTRTQREIADNYGVSESSIHYIKLRKRWAHVQ